MRRVQRWISTVAPRVVQRLANGLAPQPGWLPRWWLTVVSGDVDPNAGVGAAQLVWRPGSTGAETHTVLVERFGGQWRYISGGGVSGGEPLAERAAAGQSGQVGMIECEGGGGCPSSVYRRQHPESPQSAPWVGSNWLRVAAEVDHLLVGERRIEVPAHGALIVAWKSPSTGARGARPAIVAMGPDGSELSRIGPGDSMDSYTWARLNGQ